MTRKAAQRCSRCWRGRQERRRRGVGDRVAAEGLRGAVKGLGFEPASVSVALIPQNYVKFQDKDAQVMLKVMEVVDDHDDVQHVWANFDIEENEIEASLA